MSGVSIKDLSAQNHKFLRPLKNVMALRNWKTMLVLLASQANNSSDLTPLILPHLNIVNETGV